MICDFFCLITILFRSSTAIVVSDKKCYLVDELLKSYLYFSSNYLNNEENTEIFTQ